MADTKLSDLTALTAPASTDLLYVVDVSEVLTADQSKKITWGSLAPGVFVPPSGDTTGATDSTNITAALAAVSGNDGATVLLDGHYEINSRLSIGGTCLRGIGGRTTIRDRNSTDTTKYLITGTEGSSLQNIRLNLYGNSRGVHLNNTGSSPYSVILDNVQIWQPGAEGIRLTDMWGCHLRNIVISSQTSGVAFIAARFNRSTLQGLSINGGSFTNAVQISNSGGVYLENVNIEGSATSSSDMVSFDTCDNVSIDGLAFETVDAGGNALLYFDGANDCVTVRNVITDSSDPNATCLIEATTSSTIAIYDTTIDASALSSGIVLLNGGTHQRPVFINVSGSLPTEANKVALTGGAAIRQRTTMFVPPTGDSTGVKDKANIEAAITEMDANTGDGTIYLEGYYYTNGAINCGNVVLAGTGVRRTSIDYKGASAPTTDLITAKGIQDIGLVCNGNCRGYYTFTTETKIRNLWVYQSVGIAVRLVSANNTIINGLYLQDCDDVGISASSLYNLTVRDFLVRDGDYSTSTDTPLYLTGCTNVNVDTWSIRDLSTAAYALLYSLTSNGVSLSNVHIENCNLGCGAGAVLYCRSASSNKPLTLSNWTIAANCTGFVRLMYLRDSSALRIDGMNLLDTPTTALVTLWDGTHDEPQLERVTTSLAPSSWVTVSGTPARSPAIRNGGEEVRTALYTVDCSADQTATTGALITLSDGMVLHNVHARVTTVFDGSGTTTFEVGVSGNTDKYIDPLDIDPTSLNDTAQMIGGANNDQATEEYLTASTAIVCTVTNTGGTPSTGEITVMITYSDAASNAVTPA